MAVVLLINFALIFLITPYCFAEKEFSASWLLWFCLSLGITFWVWVIFIVMHFLTKFW